MFVGKGRTLETQMFRFLKDLDTSVVVAALITGAFTVLAALIDALISR
jgi:hypothetical protein